MNFADEMLRVRDAVLKNPCSAVQGQDLEEVREAQIHHLKCSDAHPECFALVLDVRGSVCRIVPGSFDAYEAGTGDVVVPRSVLGGYVSLSPTLVQDVPIEALGRGFATLDADSFARARKSCGDCFGFEVSKAKPFMAALPYVGDRDSRRKARTDLVQTVERSVRAVRGAVLARELKESFADWRQRAGEILDRTVVSFRPFSTASEPLLAAGDDLTDAVRTSVFRVDGLAGVELEFEYSAGSDLVLVCAYTDDEKAVSLDGSALIDGQGNVLGMLLDGKCELHLPNDGSSLKVALFVPGRDDSPDQAYALVLVEK